MRKPDDRKTEIRITQDFVADPVPFRVKPFQLSAKEKKAAERMALNSNFHPFTGLGCSGSGACSTDGNSCSVLWYS